jgi:hypothetical protein
MEEKSKEDVLKVLMDYKENPSAGDTEKIKNAKKLLLNTDAGQEIIKKSQKEVKKSVKKRNDEICCFGTNNKAVVFRGGSNVGFESDAGWTLDAFTASRFAVMFGNPEPGVYEGEIGIGMVNIEDIVFYDVAFEDYIKSKNPTVIEHEIITKKLGDVKPLSDIEYITVEGDEDGFPTEESEEKIKSTVKKYVKNINESKKILTFFEFLNERKQL